MKTKIIHTSNGNISGETLFEAVSEYVRTNGRIPKQHLINKINIKISELDIKCKKSNQTIEKSIVTVEKIRTDVATLKYENLKAKDQLLQELLV